jgi:hypothetical protein
MPTSAQTVSWGFRTIVSIWEHQIQFLCRAFSKKKTTLGPDTVILRQAVRWICLRIQVDLCFGTIITLSQCQNETAQVKDFNSSMLLYTSPFVSYITA